MVSLRRPSNAQKLLQEFLFQLIHEAHNRLWPSSRTLSPVDIVNKIVPTSVPTGPRTILVGVKSTSASMALSREALCEFWCINIRNAALLKPTAKLLRQHVMIILSGITLISFDLCCTQPKCYRPYLPYWPLSDTIQQVSILMKVA